MHGIDWVDVGLSVLKIAIVLGAMLNVTPIMVWVERRGSALIQDRPGPNRVGPFGLLQSFAVVPWGRPFLLPSGRLFEPIIANVNIGILLIFALASMGVYGIVMAGWASANKYSLFGGIRASAQMISYELSLTLAAVSVLLAAGSLSLTDVVWHQTGSFVLFNTIKLPAWN